MTIDYEYLWEHFHLNKEKYLSDYNNLPNKFKLFWPDEFVFWPKTEDQLIEISELGVDTTVLLNNIDSKYLLEKFKNIKFVDWPLHQLYRTGYYVNDQQGTYDNINLLFLTMNRRGTYHRSALIDILHSSDIINYGKFSWHNADADPKHVYQWKYWKDPHTVILDDIDFGGIDHTMKQWFVPSEFYQSLISVVSETCPWVPIITEKTFMCIWLEKPFLIAGHEDSYKILKNWGFKLHEDIFDYDYIRHSFFEKRENSIDQAIGIKENLERIKNSNYQDLRLAMEPVIKYNKQRMIELFNDDAHVPDILKQHLRYVHSNQDKSQGFDITFLKMLQHLDFLKNT